MWRYRFCQKCTCFRPQKNTKIYPLANEMYVAQELGIFPFSAGPANNLDVFAVVEFYEYIVTLYPQIFYLRVVKPS